PVVIDVRDFLLISETAASNKKGGSNYRQNYHNIYTSKFRLHDLLTPLFDLYDFININLLKILLKKLIKKSNKVKLVAISKFMKKQLIKFGFPKEKIEVIYNIVDKNIFKGKNYKRQNQIVFAGRLEKKKGIWDAIKAFELIGDNKLKFAIAGDGTEFENIKYYLKSRNCSNIKLLGKITNEQVLKLYNKSKVLVCPSIWPEPFGRFILESFTTETPLITTNVGSLPETIKNRETGITIEPNNPIKLAEAIKELLTNKKLYDGIAKNLAKEAEKYSSEVIGKQRILLYKKILKKIISHVYASC
ncbi:unnamed protein product, partial [marine sediment metagenome]